LILYHDRAVTVSFRAKLLASHALVALAVSVITLLVVERQISPRMERQIDQRLETQARAVSTWLNRAVHFNQLAHRLADVTDARVTIIDRRGVAVGESIAPEGNDDEVPEVRAARNGEVGRATRYSAFADQPMRYVAVSTPLDAVIRLGVPIGEIEDLKDQLRKQLIVAAIASLLVALGLAAVVTGPLTRRLRDATAIAHRIAAGDYNIPKPTLTRDEIGVLSASLATAVSELRANEHKRREFLATVAHEIRTPVTSIRGYAEILAKSPADSQTNREFLRTIHRNAIRIGELVEDLLELEALEAGKGPPLLQEPVVLAPVVSNVVETLRARASEVDAKIAVEVAGDTAMVGDADAIERIVLNLTDNALRHGGRGVVVTIEARHPGERAQLVVRDTGPGVAFEDRARIFERFQRGGKADRDGTGLGLAIARELAHAMNGTLVLSGASTFTLELPAARDT
jgi:signal transduction histidine kinase